MSNAFNRIVNILWKFIKMNFCPFLIIKTFQFNFLKLFIEIKLNDYIFQIVINVEFHQIKLSACECEKQFFLFSI